MAEKLLTKHWYTPECWTLANYQRHGGYAQLKKALAMAPAAVTEEVKKSVIRGRGGARFPTGLKWSFVPKNTGKPVYLVVNADEGEPGTFKDRHIMENSPHAMIEGIAIAAHAIGAKECFVYFRGEYTVPIQRTRQAIAEAEAQGLVGHVKIIVVMGAGAYICGEETGLLSSIEGKKGHPKLKPPFPAVSGLYQCPTVVNNVETLAYLPYILEMGGEKFAALGSPKNGGVALYCISGHVNTPGVIEVPMGTTLRSMIYDECGGIRDGRTLKAVIPGGSSSAVLTPDQIDAKMDSEGMAALGTMLGSGGIIVMDDRTCMVRVARNTADFYAHESCGQCTPCREGCDWAAKLIRNIEAGMGTPKDLDLINTICDNMAGKTICVFADGAALPITGFLRKFKHEFIEHLEGKCSVGKFSPVLSTAAH